MKAALRVQLTIQVHPDRCGDFIRLWMGHADYVYGLSDNHGQTLSQSRADPTNFVITSDWTDEASFRSFERSPQQRDYLGELWPMRVSGGMTLLDIIARHGAAAVR